MTQGAFVLIAGRLGDVLGHRTVLLTGCVWWVTWTLVSGFAPSFLVLALFRGLSGIGGAFMVPNAVALLAHTFPPGTKRNISMGLFGAMAPIGAAGGSVVAAVFVQLVSWNSVFFFLALLGTVVFSSIAFLVPTDVCSDPSGAIDWVGAYLGVGGLILFDFVWNQAAIVGWEKPYVYAILLVSLLQFCIFVFWEAKIAQEPIMPVSIWYEPSFAPLMVVVLLTFMSFGIFAWYTVIWMEEIRDMSLISTALAIMPLTVGGVLAAFVASWMIPRLAAQHILAVGAISVGVSSIIFATMPAQQNYWTAAFPSYAIVAFSPDLTFTAAQIIVSNAVARKQQGIAASLVGTLLTYGQSMGLGFGGTVQRYARSGQGEDNKVQSYRNALYLGIGFAVGALIIGETFVRIRKDKRKGWEDDEEELDDPVAMLEAIYRAATNERVPTGHLTHVVSHPELVRITKT